MSDAITSAQAPDDFWVTKNPNLKIGRGFGWSAKAKPLSGPHVRLSLAILLYVLLEVAVISVILGSFYLFSQIGAGADLDTPMIVTMAQYIGMASQFLPIAAGVTMIICVIVYSLFVYRAMSNLHLSNAREATITPGMAVGWSFIPFANLGMIYNVMKQIWVASHDPDKGSYSPPITLPLWWGGWITSSILGRISDSMIGSRLENADPSEFLSIYTAPAILGVVAGAISIVSCLLLLRSIKQITTAQENLRSIATFNE